MSKPFRSHFLPLRSLRLCGTLWGAISCLLWLAGCSAIGAPGASSISSPTLTPPPTLTPTLTTIPTASATPGPDLYSLVMTPNALLASADVSGALDGYRRLVELYPHSAEPLIRMAAVAQRQNDPVAAEQYFEAAATADPTDGEALRQWAIFLDQQGRYAELVKVYDRMLALTPRDPDLLIAAAMAHARTGGSAEATADLDSVMAIDPTRGYAWLNVAGAASGARQHQAAIDIASAALNALPNSAGLLMTRGLAHLSLGEGEAAITDFEAAFALDPTNSAALHWKGRALIGLARYPEAAETLRRAADLGAQSGADGVNLSYESMAYAADAMSRTNVEAAFEYLAQQVIQYGSRDGLLLGYGLVRWRQGNVALAIDRLDSLVEAGFVPALYWRGAIHAASGDRQAAIDDLLAFLKVRRSGPDVEAARQLLTTLGVDPDQP